MLETRTTERVGTIDGQVEAIGGRMARTVTQLPVAGRGGVYANASSLVLNVAVTQPMADGYLTLYPCGATRPLT